MYIFIYIYIFTSQPFARFHFPVFSDLQLLGERTTRQRSSTSTSSRPHTLPIRWRVGARRRPWLRVPRGGGDVSDGYIKHQFLVGSLLRWVKLFGEEWNGVLCSWANLSCSSFLSTPGRGPCSELTGFRVRFHPIQILFPWASFVNAPVLLPEFECKPGSLIECELRGHDRKFLGFLLVGTTQLLSKGLGGAWIKVECLATND